LLGIDSLNMIFGDNRSEKSATRSATARLDRGFTGGESGEALEHAAAQFRAAIFFPIPEGYEDEAGFHFGAPARENEARITSLTDSGYYPLTPF